jgi:hypothetical protein
MAITIKKDFVLIKSLSKSEKRQFKIFASRLETSSNTKFIELFNILDKSDLYDKDNPQKWSNQKCS